MVVVYTQTKLVKKFHCAVFFKYTDQNTIRNALFFSGNRAELGGDSVFGGCLSNCTLTTHIKFDKNVTINATNVENLFWEIIESNDPQRLNAFVSPPDRVVFCDNNVMSNDSNRTVSAFRGQPFNVSLMTVDSARLRSAGYKVEAIPGINQTIKKWWNSTKLCSNYSYSIRTLNENDISAIVNFRINMEGKMTANSVELIVNLTKCPIGYTFGPENGECICNDKLKIRCTGATEYSLMVPASTWIGKVENTEVITKYCKYCREDNKDKEIHSTEESDKLCVPHRTGVICGRCSEGYSLLMSGSIKCEDCKNSTYKGILITLLLLVVGIALIIIIAVLNLTVSIALTNSIVFYSNIVYANSDHFLPLNDTKIKFAVRFLSSFQAWINLDFGIATCFFPNYDAYTSAWSRFAYPIYIWLLILLTVCASRYSRRLAKLTASNIVPVLATLLLLSYAKLLTVSINAVSYTELYFINGKGTDTIKVWETDGHIHYLQGKHIPLFLMSILMTVAYIIPFTLLVLLGPLLQAKSHHRLLSWINKLKPLMDAFYGPYSNRYRYWPGILLLARLTMLNIFAFYPLDDVHFRSTAVTIMAVTLMILWTVIRQSPPTPPYHNHFLNYLEIFSLSNLLLFGFISGLVSSTKRQQILAVIMTGSMFAVFCAILIYQTVCALNKVCRIPSKFTRQLKKVNIICQFLQKPKKSNVEPTGEASKQSDGCTHSILQGTELTQSFELREPLLNDN